MIKLSLGSEIFTRAIDDIITRDELKNLLGEKRPLRIKHGIDATSPDLHIGHAASLWKIRALQEAGHKAVILLGDITTQIGDPTGKSKKRPEISASAIAKNTKSIREQIEKILLTGAKQYEFHKSSEWYNKIKTPEFIRILSHVTHARLIERDMFQKRINEGNEIFLHEFIYPVLQGYDSVMLRSDLTVIGSDQLFNEHMGRHIQEKFGLMPQVIISLKILPGLGGGEKMSKSQGNYIGLSDSPRDKFGKAMRILDALIVPYLEVYTDIPSAKIKQIGFDLQAGKNPMGAKLIFAEALVRRYHGSGVASEERKGFVSLFSKKNLRHIPVVKLDPRVYNIIKLLMLLGLSSSNSEAHRLIMQKAVEIDGRTISGPKEDIKIVSGTTLRVGKRRFVKIR